MQSTILVAVAIVVLIITLISISRAQDQDPDLIDIPETLSEDEKKREVLAVKKLMHEHASKKVKAAEERVIEKLDKIKAHMELKEKTILEGMIEKGEEMRVAEEKIVTGTETLQRLQEQEPERKLQLENRTRVKTEEAEEVRRTAEQVTAKAEKTAMDAKQRLAEVRAAALRKLQEKRAEQKKLREKAEAEKAEEAREAVRARQKEREALLLAQQKAQADAALAQKQLQEEQRLKMEARAAEAEEQRLAAIEEAKEIERQAKERAAEAAENIRAEEMRIAEEMEEARRVQAEAEAEEAARIAEQEQKIKEAEAEAAELLRVAEEEQAEMEAEAAELLAEQEEKIAMQKQEAKMLAEEAQQEYEELEQERKELEEELRAEAEELERLRQEEIQAAQEEYEAEQQLQREEQEQAIRDSEEQGQADAEALAIQAEEDKKRTQAQADADTAAAEVAQAESDAIEEPDESATGTGEVAAPPATFRYFCVQKPPELVDFGSMTDAHIDTMYNHVTWTSLEDAIHHGYGNPERMKKIRDLAVTRKQNEDGTTTRTEALMYLQPRKFILRPANEEGFACKADDPSCDNAVYKFPVHTGLITPGGFPTVDNITERGQPNLNPTFARGPSIEQISDPKNAGQFKYVWTFSKESLKAADAANAPGTSGYQLPPDRSRLGKMVDAIFPKTESFDLMGGAMMWFTDPEGEWNKALQELGLKDKEVHPDGSYVRVPVDKAFCDDLDGFTWTDGMCEHDTTQDPNMEKIGNCSTKQGHLFTLDARIGDYDPSIPLAERIEMMNKDIASETRLNFVKDMQKKQDARRANEASRVLQMMKAKEEAMEKLRKDCKFEYSSTIKSGLSAWKNATTPKFKTELIPVRTNKYTTDDKGNFYPHTEYKVKRTVIEPARYRSSDQQAMKKFLTFAGPQACLPCDPFTNEWLHILEEPSDPGKSSCPTEKVKKVPCEPFMTCSEYTAKVNAKTKARHDAIEASVDANKAEVKRLLNFAREESRARKRYESQVKTISSVTTEAGKKRYDERVAEKKAAWDKARKDYNAESVTIIRALLTEARKIPMELHYCKSRWLFPPPADPKNTYVGDMRIERTEKKDSITKKYFGDLGRYDYKVTQKRYPLAPDTYAVMISGEGVFAGNFKTNNLPGHVKVGDFGGGGTFKIRNVGGVDENKINKKIWYEGKSSPWQKDGKTNHSSGRQMYVTYNTGSSQTYILRKSKVGWRWREDKILTRDGVYKLEAGGKLSLVHKQKARDESHDGTSYAKKTKRTWNSCAYKRRQYNRTESKKQKKAVYDQVCVGRNVYESVNDTTKPIKDYTYYNRSAAGSTEELYNFNNTGHAYTLIANFDANDIWLVSSNGYYYSVANNRKMRMDNSLYCKISEPVITNALGGMNSIGKFAADCLADDAPKDGCGEIYSEIAAVERGRNEISGKYGSQNNTILRDFNSSSMKKIANDHYNSYK
jgi:hypothetical protein